MLTIIKARADTAVTAERIRVIVRQFYNHAIRNLLVTTNPVQPLRGAIARAPVEHHCHLSGLVQQHSAASGGASVLHAARGACR